MSGELIVHSDKERSFALITADELERVKEQANIIFKSGLMPKKFTNPEQIIVTGLYGRELGISFQRAINEINVIEGKPSASANLQLSLIRERMPEAVIETEEATDKKCVIRAKRKPSDGFQFFSYTIEEAQKAGLIRVGSGWQKNPEDMLFARAITRMGRRLFSDVLGGVAYTPEELTAAPMQSGDAIRQAVSMGAIPKRGPVVEAEVIQEDPGELDPVKIEELATLLEMASTEDEAEKAYQTWSQAPMSVLTRSTGWDLARDNASSPKPDSGELF